MSNYVCVTFGKQVFNTEYWDYKTNHYTQKQAEKRGLSDLCIAGCFGYVVIKEYEDGGWEVVDELGYNNKFLITRKDGNYSIQPKPLALN